jgi:hypothetical protein
MMMISTGISVSPLLLPKNSKKQKKLSYKLATRSISKITAIFHGYANATL